MNYGASSKRRRPSSDSRSYLVADVTTFNNLTLQAASQQRPYLRRDEDEGSQVPGGGLKSPASSASLICWKVLPCEICAATQAAWAGASGAQKLCLPGFKP
jgi:hypothetical protein